MTEYWHDIIAEKSWNILQAIRNKFRFVLIGGWAVYLWTHGQKSKDIDVVVDFKTLENLRKEFDLRKNYKLKKYEIKMGEIDIDIYVPYYSTLAIPLEKLRATTIEGFEVAALEELLILKQSAASQRAASEKGEKDSIDIMNLLLKCDIDFAKYKRLLKENKIEHFFSDLLRLVRNFREYKYFGLNPREFSLKKKEVLEKMTSFLYKPRTSVRGF